MNIKELGRTRAHREFLLIAGGVLLGGCLGPTPRRGGAPRVTPPPVVSPVPEVVLPPVAPTVPVPPERKGRVAAIWAPGPQTDALAEAQFLSQHPWMKVTAFFPDHFFGDDEKSKKAKSLFQTLVSTKQVDVVLTLPDRPVLPLVMDSNNARLSAPAVTTLPASFAWSEDVVDEISAAREAYRRRWRTAPAGMALPWGVALGPEFSLIPKLKLEWTLLPSSGTTPTLVEGFALPVIRPGIFPGAKADREDWFKGYARSILLSSGTVGPIEVRSFDDLAAFETLAGGTVAWAFVSELVKEGPLNGLPREPAKPVDFTPWIGDEEENRAWDLLGSVRQAVADYQNSGTANLHSLDLAKRTIRSAENGVFFDHFGAESQTAPGDDVMRDFTATLAQVYQVMGQPVPLEVRQGFSRKGSVTSGGTAPAAVFEREGTVLRWRDAVHDDRGPGDYFYPTGSQYPAGAWDLLAFEVRPEETQVTFAFDFAALANPGSAPSGFSLPLVDVYIDINHSPGAGSQEFLPGRPGNTESADAWEYALTVDGWGARFYQYIPGQGPRVSANFAVVKTSDTAFAVSIPRRYLRGEPDSWGFAVAVMGRLAGSLPMSVGVDPGPDHFGGGMPGHVAPPYIDILVPEGQSQRRILGAYKSGQVITLPFVRAE